eukprot:CAMPEP_0198279228 /NCGR_PEP_ID=MMETSP1447-20131203/66806_1 /TAXON_ID=420782 /ORGANISM="Chaetoceros dichaeta, Strain CCMP1751" /LENGTH=78 /DNA_ID=CAMNT_0043974377 /DNA_START=502 /DNA_END=738 /DNA_ORIENTATION=+
MELSPEGQESVGDIIGLDTGVGFDCGGPVGSDCGGLFGVPGEQPGVSIPEAKQATSEFSTESQCASHISVLQLPQFRV